MLWVFVQLLRVMPGWRTMKALASTLAYGIALTHRPPAYELLSSINIPVCIAVGERSPQSIQGVAQRLHDVIEGAHLEILPRQGHMVSPRVLLPVLEHFMKSETLQNGLSYRDDPRKAQVS